MSIHARSGQPRFFINGLNLTVVENDLALLKVKDPETLECKERIIWPACLPEKVQCLKYKYGYLHIIAGQKLCWWAQGFINRVGQNI